MSTLREQQKAATRVRLLDAAQAVFARRGYHGASVDEIAREAGATSGALYAHFAGKEDLFLALLDQTLAGDARGYAEAFGAGATIEEQTRAGADRWMQVLNERPEYFPLFIEFWAYAIREPRVQQRFGERFAALRAATGRIVAGGAEARGTELTTEQAEMLGTLVNALANGLALEKLADPEGVPDALFGDLLVLIFSGLEALLTTAPERRNQP
jgi:AcrR family transcriptional regulator